jgi:hypothetical protein
MTFKRTYKRWGLKDGEEKLRIETNSTGGQGSRRAVAPSDDDDDDDDNCSELPNKAACSRFTFKLLN